MKMPSDAQTEFLVKRMLRLCIPHYSKAYNNVCWKRHKMDTSLARGSLSLTLVNTDQPSLDILNKRVLGYLYTKLKSISTTNKFIETCIICQNKINFLRFYYLHHQLYTSFDNGIPTCPVLGVTKSPRFEAGTTQSAMEEDLSRSNGV